MPRAIKFSVFLLAILLSLQLFAAERQSIQQQIEELLSAPDVARASWGIEFTDLKSGKRSFR